MNKMKKAIASLIAAIMLVSAVSFSAFALKVADGSEKFEVFNDKFYAVVPENYIICYNKNNYIFMSDRAVDTYYISFYCFDNKDGINALALSSQKKQLDFADDIIEKSFKDYDEDFGISEVYELDANGCTCLVADSIIDSDNHEELFGICYIITCKNNIYLITFESYGTFPEEDITTVMESFSANDERFGDEKEKNHCDFTDALPLSDALENDVTAYDEAVFGNGARQDFGAIDPDDYDDTFDVFASVFTAVVFMIPTVAVAVIAIVFICKYVKNKKKLREYEEKYGGLMM